MEFMFILLRVETVQTSTSCIRKQELNLQTSRFVFITSNFREQKINDIIKV